MLFKSEKGIFLSEKVERWDSGLDPIGFLDLVPFVGRSFVHQHIEYFKLYCDAILGNQGGFEWSTHTSGRLTTKLKFLLMHIGMAFAGLH